MILRLGHMKKTKIKFNAKKGRGVYADELVAKGDQIEVCQLVVLNLNEVGKKLEGYVFGLSKQKVALALGNGSLYNHSDNPNAFCSIDTQNKILFIEALSSIKKGQEITIDYGYTNEERERFRIK